MLPAPQPLDTQEKVIGATGFLGGLSSHASDIADAARASNAIATTLKYKSLVKTYDVDVAITDPSTLEVTHDVLAIPEQTPYQFMVKSFNDGTSFFPKLTPWLEDMEDISRVVGWAGLILSEAPDIYTTATNWGTDKGDTALGDALFNGTAFGLTCIGAAVGDGPGALIGMAIGITMDHFIPSSWKLAVGKFLVKGGLLSYIASLFSNQENDLASLYAPDIYLYPTQQEQVQVSLGDTGDLTSTIPSYPKGGWRVDAMPSGQLSSDSQKYGYLWYEASVNATWQTQTGWIVSGGRDGFIKWAQDNLPPLGLNSKETSDFIDYWQTRLPQEPYYLVAPQTEALIDQTMPLQINPAPQTMLRVWLYVTPLSYPVSIKPFTAQPPVRRGFTAVEWGVAM